MAASRADRTRGRPRHRSRECGTRAPPPTPVATSSRLPAARTRPYRPLKRKSLSFERPWGADAAFAAVAPFSTEAAPPFALSVAVGGVAAIDDSRQLNLHEDPRGRPDGEAGRFERADELA